MNFQSLLKECTPVEYGDFFRLYRISNRGYVIYCNENNVICCMELYGFTDISVIMLAELLKVNLEELEDCEEFSLPVRCSRQQIIDYLFDVSAKETNVKLKHVSGLHGYLLKSIHQDKSGLDAYRNLFQFDPVKGTTRLLFDDNQCLASIRTDKSGSVYICWNPVFFFGLDKSGDPDSTGYLLASSSTLLIDYVLSKISFERDIIVMAGSNYLEALLFISSFVTSQDLSYKLSVCYDDMNVTIQFLNWPTPQKIINFISQLNKHIPNGYEKLSCVMVNKKIYLQVPAIRSYLKPLLYLYYDLLCDGSLKLSLLKSDAS